MDVRLSPEQEELRRSVTSVVERLGPQSVADLDDASRRAKLDAAVEATGWREVRCGTDDGTPLGSGVEACVVAEELARCLADVAFVGPILAADLRRRAGAGAAAGIETVILGAAMADAGSPDAPGGVAVDASGAGTALVLVGTGAADGPRLASVVVRDGGVQLDLTRRTAEMVPGTPVDFVDGAHELGDDDRAAWRAFGLALTCADLVGVMRGAITLARDYALARRQYDAPIGSFQVVQHMLADAHVAMEGSRSVALHAAWAVDGLPAQEALAAAALAKAYCARAARAVCETAVQVHGGIGNTWDCLAHVFLRRALLSIDAFGGADVNVERVLSHNGIGIGAGSSHGLR